MTTFFRRKDHAIVNKIVGFFYASLLFKVKRSSSTRPKV